MYEQYDRWIVYPHLKITQKNMEPNTKHTKTYVSFDGTRQKKSWVDESTWNWGDQEHTLTIEAQDKKTKKRFGDVEYASDVKAQLLGTGAGVCLSDLQTRTETFTFLVSAWYSMHQSCQVVSF